MDWFLIAVIFLATHTETGELMVEADMRVIERFADRDACIEAKTTVTEALRLRHQTQPRAAGDGTKGYSCILNPSPGV